MRRAITLTLDDEFIRRMDRLRDGTSRGRWIEAGIDEPPPSPPARSPEVELEDEIPEMDRWGEPVGTVYDETDPRSFA